MGSDPSRIVAQIVSGIGFLGAGTIFRFGTSVKGLTTAASLWAICGVGIAIGVGLYFAALLSVLFIMAVLALLELFEQRLRTRGVHLIQVLISDIPGTIGKIGEKLGEMEVNIKNIKMLREGKSLMRCYLWLDLPAHLSLTMVLSMLQELDTVQEVEVD
jgi:putative Mg2+ transporter-C (MgtC) family protein